MIQGCPFPSGIYSFSGLIGEDAFRSCESRGCTRQFDCNYNMGVINWLRENCKTNVNNINRGAGNVLVLKTTTLTFACRSNLWHSECSDVCYFYKICIAQLNSLGGHPQVSEYSELRFVSSQRERGEPFWISASCGTKAILEFIDVFAETLHIYSLSTYCRFFTRASLPTAYQVSISDRITQTTHYHRVQRVQI